MRLVLPLIALATLAAPALAAPQVNAQTVTIAIPYGDVDLTSTDGRAALEARIDAALRKACTRDVSARYLHASAAVDGKCVAEAKVAALAEVARVAAAETGTVRKVAVN